MRLDAIVVENCQGDGSFPDTTCTDERYGFVILRQTENFFDQLVASETIPRRRGRYLSGCTRTKRQEKDSLQCGVTDLVWV
jgi:hypothetical protein